MFFTREDILKIQNALLKLSVKDSELPSAEPVTYDDTLSIVQDGKNKQIKIEDFFNQISLWKREDFINITDKYDEHYISLIEAIKLVPILQRKDGLVITFQDIEGNWEIYQFRGNITEFFEENKWFNLYDYRNNIIQSIVPDEEDLTASIPDETGNSLVSLKDRVYDPTSFSGKGYKILRKNIQSVNIAVTKIKVEFSPSSDGTLSFSINGKETQVSVSVSVDNTTILVADKIASKLTETMTEYEVSKDASTITLIRKFNGSVTPSLFSANITGVVCTVTDSSKRESRNIITKDMINKPNTIYEIRYDFDLDGATLEVPDGCILKFLGGKLTNGTIRYNDTYILGHINLENVFEIGLIHRQPFMLEVNPKFKQEHIQTILNTSGFILFRKGKYHLSIDKPSGFGLKICSNTTIFLEEGCEFSISPNSFSHYSIFLFSGCQNVRVVGTLNIKGDNFSHLNNDGEWGSGVVFEDCNNITIDKIISNECFGDGVRFGGAVDADKPYPEKITIGDILANRNGRLGVSVISAKDVYIGSIIGSENNRTPPKALIDLEPTTTNNIIQNFNIKSIVSKHNYGGAIWIINSNNAHDTSINIGEIISEEDSFNSAEYEAAIRFSSSPNEKDIQVCGQINIEKIKIIKPLKRGLMFSRWSSKEIPINIGHLSIEECKYDNQILVMADSTLKEIGGLNIKDTNIKSSKSQRGWLRVIGNQSTDIKIDFGFLNLSNITINNDITGITNNSNINYYSIKNNKYCCGIISPEGEVLDRTFNFTVNKVGTGQYNINLGTNDKGVFFVNFESKAYFYTQSNLSNGKYRINIYNSEKVLSDVRFNFVYFSFSNNYLVNKNSI